MPAFDEPPDEPCERCGGPSSLRVTRFGEGPTFRQVLCQACWEIIDNEVRSHATGAGESTPLERLNGAMVVLDVILNPPVGEALSNPDEIAHYLGIVDGLVARLDGPPPARVTEFLARHRPAVG